MKVTDPKLLALLNASDGEEVTDPALLAQLNAEEPASQSYESGTIADWLYRKGRQVDEAIQGDASEELPSAFSPEFEAKSKAPIRDAVSSLPELLFGQDEDLGRKLADQVGGQLTQDDNGNAVVQTPDGKRFYVNQPGLDRHDVERFGGQIAAYLPAGRLAGGVAGLGGRMLAMGGGAAATNLAGQGMAREKIDPGEAAVVGAFGAGGELIGPIYRATANALKVALGRVPTAAELGAAFGKKLGMDVSKMDRPQLERLNGLAQERAAGASRESVQGEGEFNFRYTQGQKTGDHGMLSEEELMRQGSGDAADRLRGVMTQNEDTLTKTVRGLTERYGGGQPATSPIDAFGRTQAVVQWQAAELGGKVDRAYSGLREAAKTDRANVSVNSLKGLPTRIVGVLQDFPTGQGLTPATDAVLANIKGRIAGLPEGTKAVDLATLDTQRRLINNAYKAAANPTDRAALTLLKREYDGWMDETYKNALSADKLIPLRDAQRLRSEYGKRFEGRGGDAQMDSFIEDMVSGGKTADELINTAFGMTQVSRPIAARYIARLKVAFKDSPEALDGLRAAHFMKLTMDKAGQRLGMQAIRNNILGTERNAPATIRELYKPEEWAQLKRLADALDPMIPKGDFARSSGTAERLARMMGNMKALPGVRTVLENIEKRIQTYKAAKVMDPIRAPRRKDLLLPASSAAAGQNY